ncbi:hypothetical protein [Polyangium sp. y55x31]|uniref:hypothetical protein n=1 Tax=Polyangium sp. y55x31 TaxID=3042688 RepID=UPI002482D9F0|nr:hypothetical protein [Polyangium sp. y55x31]MDI1475235.1 hypothetical protein [Polyangium sp. y55x31]
MTKQCACLGCRLNTFSDRAGMCMRCDDALFCVHCIECGEKNFQISDRNHPRCHACASVRATDTCTVVVFGRDNSERFALDCMSAAQVDWASLSRGGNSGYVRGLRRDAFSLALYLFPEGVMKDEQEALDWRRERTDVVLLVRGAIMPLDLPRAPQAQLDKGATATDLVRAIEHEAVRSGRFRRPWISG